MLDKTIRQAGRVRMQLKTTYLEHFLWHSVRSAGPNSVRCLPAVLCKHEDFLKGTATYDLALAELLGDGGGGVLQSHVLVLRVHECATQPQATLLGVINVHGRVHRVQVLDLADRPAAL